MIYRHTLKRFTIDRLEKEDIIEEFLHRAEQEAIEKSRNFGIEYSISTDYYMSYISDKNIPSKDGSLKDTIRAIVVEINEIPEIVHTDLAKLLIYHDEIKEEYEGKIIDIDCSEAESYILDKINRLKSHLRDIERIREINE